MSSLLQHAPSDEQLTTAVAAGDEAAFEELYRRYAQPLAAYGGRVLRDRSRGEDVAQTSLMRAYDALRRGTEPLRVKPWLYKIALNTALELKAKNGDVLDGESEELEDTSTDFSPARADIVAGIQALPERQRLVFILREIKGLPVAEVGGRLELDSTQVEQALFAARNRLAEALVFGERVDCELVRGLDRSRLTHYERRAIKSHVRSCRSCRRTRGLGLSAIGFWLRDLWAWFAGGGATAAKLGAVAITAAAVGSAPVVVPAVTHRVLRHDSPTVDRVAHADARVTARAPRPRVAVRAPGVLVREHSALRLPSVAIEEAAEAAGAEAEEVVPAVTSEPEVVSPPDEPPAQEMRQEESTVEPVPSDETNVEVTSERATDVPVEEPPPAEEPPPDPAPVDPVADERPADAPADNATNVAPASP
jgi:RNA polymerase sigma factor (sigma-70 family)